VENKGKSAEKTLDMGAKFQYNYQAKRQLVKRLATRSTDALIANNRTTRPCWHYFHAGADAPVFWSRKRKRAEGGHLAWHCLNRFGI